MSEKKELMTYSSNSFDDPPPYESISVFSAPLHQQLNGKRIILASTSPRRKRLLQQMGFTTFEIQAPDISETVDPSLDLMPWEYCVEMASSKALCVYKLLVDTSPPPALILAADTVVLSGNTMLKKPRSQTEQLAILKKLRDSKYPHKVFTGVAVIVPLKVPIQPGYNLRTHVEESEVTFDTTITDDFLEAYVSCGEGADKAGGYGIQGYGALLVESIKGDYTNIIGLPLRSTYKLMEKTLNEDAYDDLLIHDL
ncbi:septum formation protein Maf [Pneumocystis carinii B80]|uniref:Septum formation protein Maf n=1 Tax=Pneumocystis carinii (strain B80) TaxID=1408658 RepID=A0A0W4ZPP4_PNEC8|nr:septum formation protein Maf [Pneumocystis carinii B80]KTW30332.1 septum formation protein Maf [Pneumocystis carinii B80]